MALIVMATFCIYLPSLPKDPKILWKAPLGSLGLGGIAATSEYVLVSERGLMIPSMCIAA